MGFEPIPEEARPWEIVFKTGWTLEYIDSLPETKYREFWLIRDGKIKSKRW
jgi:hypothetical protein